jgi:periplasmic protein TonB
MEWIIKNMDSRLKTTKNQAKRIVYVSFIVEADGTTSDFKVEQAIGEPYDSEALRLMRSSPHRWVAGECEDKKVRTKMMLPVKF